MDRPPYSEVAATLEKLRDVERKFEDTEKLLQRILQFSQVAPKRAAVIDANGINVIARHLRNNDSVPIQQYTAAILLNLGLNEKGRVSLSSCNSWACLSYRHECPLFFLLQLAHNAKDMVLKRICTAATTNCSFHAACQVQMDEINGTPILLKLLNSTDEDVAVYAAATLWCLCKDNAFLVRLETIYCIPVEGFKQKLSLVLWTRCLSFGLSVTASKYSSDQTGILDCVGDNTDLVFTAAINGQLSMMLQMEHYNIKQTQAQVQGKMQFKSVQKFNGEGVLVATTCAVCAKPIKEKQRLGCVNDHCTEVYHVRCSRWRHLGTSIVDESRSGFYCDVCSPKCPLQYVDFLAIEASNVLAKHDFGVLGVTRDAGGLCALQGQSLEIVGIGLRKYVCPGKYDIAVVQLKYTCRACTSLCHNTQPPPPFPVPVNPWTFAVLQTTVVSPELRLNQLVLWPTTKTTPIDANLYLCKSSSDLDLATVLEFQAASSTGVFALGSADGRELWSGLHPSRAKCMKLVSEALAAAKGVSKPKKAPKAKPHIQRTLERQPSAGQLPPLQPRIPSPGVLSKLS
ncbi:hypothetical protein ACHHYP_15196 [Achlya hypogyna]|uniref:Zinc finger PHD-type domain-containing protein n=1 Tax=Achlya hypogyna TaxID=1202772 RepID=A0A1V9YBD7_ACHHY|nr:hypothetical protein ACHHYP_15196 [Achlya hypogyna]